ncbi:hypothetical protein L1987_58673 [Smallanthus sonchifolius]|uniref:Uncharacterized protein n=1 Tax=Smallanthus sonchifolius TaxID=185202 RepID=A0ACB9D336_9ASTR|nr:hypothetical protein L1987_58673 [Smallanthus sonchifolius]
MEMASSLAAYSGRIRLQDGSEGGCTGLRMKVSLMEVAVVTSRPVAAVGASDLMVVNSGRYKKLNGGTDDGLDGGSSVEEMVGVQGGFMVVSVRRSGFVAVHSVAVVTMTASRRWLIMVVISYIMVHVGVHGGSREGDNNDRSLTAVNGG